MKLIFILNIFIALLAFQAFAQDKAPVATPSQKGPAVVAAQKSVSVYLDFVDTYVAAQVGLGQCPCFRIAIQTKLLSGKIETKNFIFKSDGVANLDMNRGINFRTQDSLTKKIFKLGATEVMWKNKVLGLYFPGVTFGSDLDRGYTEIIQTGMHLLLSAYTSKHAQVDFRIGYNHQQGKVNLFRDFSDDLFHASFNVVIHKGKHRFGFNAAYELVAQKDWMDHRDHYRTYGNVFYNVDFVQTNYFDMYLGLSAHGEADFIRQHRHYLAPYNLTVQLLVGGRFHSKPEKKSKKKPARTFNE